jgi:hypothetical protein
MNKDEKEIIKIIEESNNPYKTAMRLLTLILKTAQQS